MISFQMLLFGLLLCCASAVVHVLRPSKIVCSVARIASGASYSIVYATLLVKLVFLVSLNGGVYLPATYQSLLLCFAILIQVRNTKAIFCSNNTNGVFSACYWSPVARVEPS